MDRLWQDIRYGARLLGRFPGVTATALLALALGTGVNTALLQPLPFPDADELVQVVIACSRRPAASLSVGAINMLPIAATG